MEASREELKNFLLESLKHCSDICTKNDGICPMEGENYCLNCILDALEDKKKKNSIAKEKQAEKEEIYFTEKGIARTILLNNALNDKSNFGNKEVHHWLYTSKEFVMVSISYDDFKMINYWFPMKSLYLYDDEYINEIVRTLYTLLENNPRFAKEEEKKDGK